MRNRNTFCTNKLKGNTNFPSIVVLYVLHYNTLHKVQPVLSIHL